MNKLLNFLFVLKVLRRREAVYRVTSTLPFVHSFSTKGEQRSIFGYVFYANEDPAAFGKKYGSWSARPSTIKECWEHA